MKKLLVLIVTFCFTLVACSTKTEQVSQERERLLAFLIANNQLYVIGEKNDYQFSGPNIDKFDRFMKSNYTKYIQKAEVSISITDASNVKINYQGMLKTLPETDKQAIREKYELRSNNSIYFETTGQLVKLQNRDEILAKNPVNSSFFANVSYYKGSLDIGEGIKSILMLPIAVVAILPTAVIWGALCAGDIKNCFQ